MRSRAWDFLGITPACAGNSSESKSRAARLQDHPRVCGEQFMLLSLQKAVVGSPPRVRGTEQYLGQRDLQEGITPACAGNRAAETVW